MVMDLVTAKTVISTFIRPKKLKEVAREWNFTPETFYTGYLDKMLEKKIIEVVGMSKGIIVKTNIDNYIQLVLKEFLKKLKLKQEVIERVCNHFKEIVNDKDFEDLFNFSKEEIYLMRDVEDPEDLLSLPFKIYQLAIFFSVVYWIRTQGKIPFETFKNAGIGIFKLFIEIIELNFTQAAILNVISKKVEKINEIHVEKLKDKEENLVLPIFSLVLANKEVLTNSEKGIEFIKSLESKFMLDFSQ